MDFDSTKYGTDIAQVFTLDATLEPALIGPGQRLHTLSGGPCTSEQVRQVLSQHKPEILFSNVKDPGATMAGLWLYFSCFEEAHKLIDDSKTSDGIFWHAILHRREPDAGNAAYWFRQLGEHPIFRPLATEVREILKRNPTAEFRIGHWDPFAFINFCERAREQPGSIQETTAREIQRAEWQLLFDHCARPQ